ncbi:LOW QUALITY PROTEIN: AF4/FMR2 family member lilli [Drosophila ficusphila]|uniref:LOW QUALITY PROTEIN: AF4/FMR2 family member lilli n=1 Tax=Drosophila ficusphila TaxID=30025 RepID=UPI001C88F06C|nr:LOW QUALITY PROTEIN: AF4/FMR2 family member lilli [Drosophila ficusphila]
MAQQQQQQLQQQHHSSSSNNNNSILLLQQQPQQEQLQQYNNNLYSQNYNMEEYERRKRREREKIERQQGIQIDDRETSLFGEPRRLTENDAEITAALGEFGEARVYINQSTVGISRNAPAGAVNPRLQAPPLLPPQGKSPSASASASAASSSAGSANLGLPNQQQQQQQHYQQQQRPSTYLKQTDNKPPYNGRGGYPGQPMKNDIPSSSGMAPPRGPPRSSANSSSSNSSSSATNNANSSQQPTLLGPPLSTQTPNGREKSFLGPPAPALHNGTGGRFVPPAASQRPGAGQQPPPPEKDVNKIFSAIKSNFGTVTPLTLIAATPHAPLTDNFNPLAPNKKIYAIDMIGGSSPTPEPSSSLFSPIAPIASPISSIMTTPPQASQLPLGGAASGATSVVEPLAPLLQLPPTPPKAANVITSPATAKPLKTEKNHTLEKQDSCLENDLELSESEDEQRKKEGRSAGNSSNSSESDSSESGSESSSKNDQQHHPNHHQQQQHHLLQQQQQSSILQQQQQQQSNLLQQQHRSNSLTSQLTSNGAQNKKVRHEIIARGSNTITGLLNSSVFGSGASGGGAGSGVNSNSAVGGAGSVGGTLSSGGSSSNKTPSPTESNKWTLSRFFHKPANQTNSSESVSPGNVSMKVPGILPGGAQIIPESIDVTTAIVKNEKLHDDHMDMEEGEEEDDDEEQQQQQLRYGAGLSVTPVGVAVAVKKEAIDAIDAIPKIKRESAEALIAARLSDSGTSGSGSGSSSSSSSSSDSGQTGGEVAAMPMLPGPGETLQLPGVPAAITTVMRVPPQQAQKAPPSNSVTLTPILQLPASPKQRQKKPRKKKAVTSAPILDSSDDDEPPPKHPGLEHPAGAALQQAQPATSTEAVKKGRGRPRKQQQSGGSGNLSSASAGSSSQTNQTTTTTKGPTLTAAKKPLAKAPLAMSRARKRDHSSHSHSQSHSQSSSNGNTPTKKLAATPVLVGGYLKPSSVRAGNSSSSDEDSSSSAGSSSKSSSSSSSSDDTETQNTNCRIVKLNKTGAGPPMVAMAPLASGSSSPNSSSGSEPEHQNQARAGQLMGSGGQSQAQQLAAYKPMAMSQHSQQLSSSECSSSSGGCGGGGGGSSSSGEEDEASRRLGEKERERKPKSDKNKISTLTRIFNPKEGGAKKQGQVVIVDLQEEQQQGKLDAAAAAAQPPQAAVAAANAMAKPRMTPTQQQNQHLGASLASPARTTTPHLTSLICKIDLSKLSRERIMRLKKLTPAQQNGHLTPKDQQTHLPNGYSTGDSNSNAAAAAKVKHEHPVKPEPELDAGYESKFKPGNVKQEFQLKQERDRERERERDRERDQPPGRRRKRSSSSSSSPYKEKKRKKEKADQLQIGKELLPVPVLLPSNNHERMPNHDRLSYDKLQLLREDAAAAAAAAAAGGVVVADGVVAPNGSPSKKLLAMSPLPPPPTATHVPPATCNEAVQTTPPSVTLTTATVATAPAARPPPITRLIYRSYFDREEEHPSDDHRKNNQFLQEAINRKHAADSERDSFNQVTLYLEAVVYFLLTADAMERCSSETATYTMYKDTLSLIKFISTKFRPYQQSTNGQHETHNKVAILSLRCQSLISLKLYKLRRANCRAIINSLTDFFRVGRGDIVNGNTPSSISPSNSVGSQGSGSNTPPGKIVPQDIHNMLCKQNEYLSYLNSAHELWDQADRLVRTGNHIDFFRELDHENGPLTLHSTMHEVFRYVQAGLKTLRDAVSHPTHQAHQSQ